MGHSLLSFFFRFGRAYAFPGAHPKRRNHVIPGEQVGRRDGHRC